jgi:hypothetical protein
LANDSYDGLQAFATGRKGIMLNWFSIIGYVVIDLPAKAWRAIFDHELLTNWWYSHYR